MSKRPQCTCSANQICRPCVLIATRPDYVALWNVSTNEIVAAQTRTHTKQNGKPVKPTYPCVYRGERTGERRVCTEGCGAGTLIPLQQCSVYGSCSVTISVGEGVPVCKTCPGRQETSRIVVQNLPGHFNASVCEYKGRVWIASRYVGRVFLSELIGTHATQTQRLDFDLPGNQEDPRLFIHEDQLHIGFACVTLEDGQTRVRQGYARISSGVPQDTRVIQYGDQQMEKNWGWFSTPSGGLYAVYGMIPNHVILQIRGDKATPVFSSPNPFPWSGGHARGGSPPIRVGQEYIAFFHGQKQAGAIQYSVGAYAFSAVPPFRILRQTPQPLQVALPADTHPERKDVHVLFPSGAIKTPGGWCVSQGVGDSWIELVDWSY